VSCMIVAVSAAGWRTHGLPQRFSREVLELAGETEPISRFGPTEMFEPSEIDDVVADSLPALGDSRRGKSHPHFLLWGDSHATVISGIANQLAKDHGVAGRIACHFTVPPVLDTSCPAQDISANDWNRAVLEFVKRSKIRHVILVARWSVYIEGSSKAHLIGDTPAEAKRAFKAGMQRTIDELRSVGVKVWVVKQVPEQQGSPRRALALAKFLPWRSSPNGISISEHRRLQANVNEILGAFDEDGIRLLDPAESCFDDHGGSRIGGDGESYYRDNDHLSRLGAEVLLGEMLYDVFAEIAADCAGSEK
ncbi:MAG TPA: SGNH hydrolase domain-containing protein, partial [Pirellulales bacterium]|nr:SGNH hydrolase domain-containing protein [Pirellulales bacterium]